MEPKEINLTEAKAKLASVIDRVIAGEDIVITRHGEPVAKVTKVELQKKRSLLGLFEGQIKLSETFPDWPEEEAHALGIID